MEEKSCENCFNHEGFNDKCLVWCKDMSNYKPDYQTLESQLSAANDEKEVLKEALKLMSENTGMDCNDWACPDNTDCNTCTFNHYIDEARSRIEADGK